MQLERITYSLIAFSLEHIAALIVRKLFVEILNNRVGRRSNQKSNDDIIDTGHGKKYGTKNTAQLRFFDPPAPPYFNVGTKRMTVQIPTT